MAADGRLLIDKRHRGVRIIRRLAVSDGVLCAVESVNRPSDHMLARRLLAKQTRVSRAKVLEPGFTLKMI